MKIAFLHYHLRTGGVATVLRQQVEALNKPGDVLVLTGELPTSSFPASVAHIPELGYDPPALPTNLPPKVAESIIEAIFSRWENGCDLLHVHNPTLGKNRILSQVLEAVKASGIKLFLQIHDFAEDGRPHLYSFDEYVPDVHYGVINSRDYEALLKAGLKKEGLHLIPNTIHPLKFRQRKTKPGAQVLYPVRAIRRKNIGEALLLSLFFKNQERLSISLPPTGFLDVKSYQGWKQFVKKKGLNVAFDTGLTTDFEEQVLSSRFLITTSITEGFGFSFLEPWTAQRILWGRKLPQICRDFEQNGIQLDHLYLNLKIPIDWIGREQISEKRKSCLFNISKTFHYPIDEGDMETAFKNATRDRHIDFGLLDEAFQKNVISRVLFSKKAAKHLIDINPHLLNPGELPDKERLINRNRKAVLDHYNPAQYREKMIKIYSRVIKKPVRQKIDKKILLSEFVNLADFSLLKWSDHVEP